MKSLYEERIIAIRRYVEGEAPSQIYTSLGRSPKWFFKWKRRYELDGLDGLKDLSRAPNHQAEQTDDILEEIFSESIKRNYSGLTSPNLLKRSDRDPVDQKRFEKFSTAYDVIPIELLNLANGSYSFEEIFLLLKVRYPEVTLDDFQFLVQLFLKEGLLTSY